MKVRPFWLNFVHALHLISLDMMITVSSQLKVLTVDVSLLDCHNTKFKLCSICHWQFVSCETSSNKVTKIEIFKDEHSIREILGLSNKTHFWHFSSWKKEGMNPWLSKFQWIIYFYNNIFYIWSHLKDSFWPSSVYFSQYAH
jgi:hypothetical protein